MSPDKWTPYFFIRLDCKSFSALQIPDERRAVVVFGANTTQADDA